MNLRKGGQPNLSFGSGNSAFVQASNEISVSKTFDDSVDVILVLLPKYEKEYLPRVQVKTRENGDIDLSHLVEHLKTLNFPVEKNMISYYSYQNDIYVYCGIDPVLDNTHIPAREISVTGDNTKQITLRIRQVHSTSPTNADSVVEQQDRVKVEPVVSGSPSDEDPAPKQKRTKERKIGEILNKVLQWRKMYAGTVDPSTGQIVKLSLEDAAQKVGISKKSLDDYLLQIRFGKKYGFNFSDHYEDRVGVLRAFVKKFKNKKVEKADDDNFDFPTEFESLIQKKDKYGNEVKNEVDILNKKSKKI